MSAALDQIRIVLVEPAGPLNVGSVARVMKNMGLSRLVLVNPHCSPMHPEAQQMAVHAQDVLAAAEAVATLPEALTGCYRAIATTGRARDLATPLEPPRQALPWLLDTPSALIFGPEDRGLSNAELNYAHRCVGIPSNPAYPSLNLAQAVAVCCYELYQLAQAPVQPISTLSVPSVARTDAEPLASLDAMEQGLQHLQTLLLEVGYLHPHTVSSRMQKVRQIMLRSQLSTSELALLRGMVRQMNWALTQTSPPSSTPNHS